MRNFISRIWKITYVLLYELKYKQLFLLGGHLKDITVHLKQYQYRKLSIREKRKRVLKKL